MLRTYMSRCALCVYRDMTEISVYMMGIWLVWSLFDIL